MRIFFCVIVALSLFSGCATRQKPPISVDSQQHLQQLQNLNNWRLKGRIAFISPEDKNSASFNWHQQSDRYELKLTSSLGISIMSMQGSTGFVELQADDQRYTDNNASALIERVTGWIVPVEQLQQWVKGAWFEQDNVVFNSRGLAQQIAPDCDYCAKWQIAFSRYRQVRGVWLPFYIEMRDTKGNQLKIRARSWEFSLDE